MHRIADPEFVSRIEDSFTRQGFMKLLGARIEELTPGRCVIGLPFRDGLSQQHGFFHGGVVGALADNACAYSAFTLIEAHQSMLTVEYKVNLVAAARGARLRAVGEVVRAGRTLSVSQVQVFASDEDRESVLCAFASVTMMTLRSRGDGKQN